MVYRHTAHPCPACSNDLSEEIKQSSTKQCSHCGGMWITKKSLQARVEASQPQNWLQPEVEFEDLHKTSERRCPTFQRKLALYRCAEVEVDLCPKDHGIWFDPNELQSALLTSTSVGEKGEIEVEEVPSPQAASLLFSLFR